MEIITTSPSEEFIKIEDLDEKEHMIVAIIRNTPTVLIKKEYEQPGFIFSSMGPSKVSSQICTTGSGWDFEGTPTDNPKSFHDIIRYAIDEMSDTKVRAFHKKDWKKALYFLLNNIKS